jgi:CheY-like chemotaxis protein
MPADQAAEKMLLVIEDQAVARESLSVLLRRAGYTVEVAENGQEALELLRGGLAPDLILLDMAMPVMDGWDFLLQLKAEPSLTTAAIIILTGTILPHEWAQDRGYAGFLSKPVEPNAMLEEIRRCFA